VARRKAAAPPKEASRPTATGRIAIIAAAAGLIAVASAWFIASAPRSSRPDILLITIDTLRADHVGAYGATTGATPTLDALSSRGVRFDRADTAVPLTGPSHATLLTGQYPPAHGVRGNVVFTLGNRYPTAAMRLKKLGYATAAFVGAYPVAAAFGFAQGFDAFDESFHESNPGEQGAERRANDVSDAATRWLASAPRPYFAWLHYYDPHAPYDPPEPFRSRFAQRAYDGEIAFTDQQIARVLDTVRASGRDSNTIVVVVADHGEGLGDHGELTHGVLIYQSTMRVPLLIAGPGIEAGRTVKIPVATIDVLPTLLGFAGAAPDRDLPGRDLRPVLDGRTIPDDPLYSESLFGRLNMHWATLRGWTAGSWKLITGANTELYDLDRDPSEQHDLASAESQRVDRMRDQLQRALSRIAPGGDRAQTNPITAEQEQRLRSLGYAAGSGGNGPLDDPSLPDPRTHVGLYDRLQSASLARGPALARAFDDVQAITRIDPNDPFAFGTLASMAYRFGSLTVAADAFARALELDPDRPGVRQNYGKLLRELDRLTESEQQLRLALAQAGDDDVRTTISLAETLIAAAKADEARRLIDGVLAKEPNHPEALAARAHLLIRERRFADAVAVLEQITAGSEPDPLIELAEAAIAAGDRNKARSAADEALRRSPGHPWALAVAGRTLAVDGQRGIANDYLRRALAAGPRRPGVWRSLAAGFEALGEHAEAARCEERAAEAGGTGKPQPSTRRK
jgi:arylsulfatase A-like enzyme/Tfp pilus assembly protein PilF